MKTKNIIFVGMPGSGKSVLAKLVAKSLNREYIDTDKIIEIRYKKTPSETITSFGEEHFRNLESKIINQYTKLSGKVISTGGGAVLRKENREALKKNSIIIFIKRDTDKLSQKNRPLSKNADELKKMYDIRLPLYTQTADFEVYNNSDINECVNKILSIINENKVSTK